MTTCRECKTTYDSHSLPDYYKGEVAARGYPTNCPVCAFLAMRRSEKEAVERVDDLSQSLALDREITRHLEKDNTKLLEKLRRSRISLDSYLVELDEFLEPYDREPNV